MGFLKTCQRLRRSGVFAQVIPVGEDGQLKPEAVSQCSRVAIKQEGLPVGPSLRYILAAQIHQHLHDTKHTCFWTALLLAEASNPKKKHRYHLPQKALVFGQDAPSVFHRYIQRPPVELHPGNAELEPAHQSLFEQTVAPSAPGGRRPSTHVWS